MLGTGLQFRRGYGEDRFYNPVKARKNHYHQNQNQQEEELQRSRSNGALCPSSKKGKGVVVDEREPENRAGSEELEKPMAMPASGPITPPSSNLDRFLESTTPSVAAQYLSKTSMKGWRTCNVEFQPFFVLGELWESFKEWSAYGAGVPLILNGSDYVIQYYVPYLSGIQIYGESTRSPIKPRYKLRPGEESDGDFYKDSSSSGSSDNEHERGMRYPRGQWSSHHLTSEAAHRLRALSLRDKPVALQEDLSSDEGELGTSRGCLLLEFFEQDSPYSREPLADKISDLVRQFPELRTLRSCDLLSTSWISVAWYPIYRIPTGPTLRDTDACFLTFHSLSTPMSGVAHAPLVTFPNGVDGVPKLSLPVFGLASYKCKGSTWTTNGGCERQLAASLLQNADDWLRLLQVDHPDFQFFASNGTCRR